MQPVIPGRQNNPLVSPALDGGHVSVSPGSTEQEEEEGDDLKPTKAVQRFKNSLTSQVFLETKSPFLRSVHILFAFEVCLKELASCFEGHVRIVDRIPDAFEHNKGVCLLESTAALNVELYSVTVQRFHSPRSPASGFAVVLLLFLFTTPWSTPCHSSLRPPIHS